MKINKILISTFLFFNPMCSWSQTMFNQTEMKKSYDSVYTVDPALVKSGYNIKKDPDANTFTLEYKNSPISKAQFYSTSIGPVGPVINQMGYRACP